jgi:hypothetical protein
MKRIVLKVRWSVKERLRKNKVRDAGTKVRYLMIFNALHGRSCPETATVLKFRLSGPHSHRSRKA